MPILYPGDLAEVARPRPPRDRDVAAAGVWSALKIVADVADGDRRASTCTRTGSTRCCRWRPSTAAVRRRPRREPARALGPSSSSARSSEVRYELARQYAVENDLNRGDGGPAGASIGLVASGFTYHELLRGPRPPRASTRRRRDRGRRHPPAPDAHAGPVRRRHVRRFARGLRGDRRDRGEAPEPRVARQGRALRRSPTGPSSSARATSDGRTLMPGRRILDADTSSRPARAPRRARLDERLVPLRSRHRHPALGSPSRCQRTPFFCSGCPHNRSTKVPEGSLVGAGIGCHTMVLLMDEERDRRVAGLAVMGNEGTQWIGMSPLRRARALRAEPRRRHVLPLRAARRSRRRWRRREHHLQAALQRHRRDDRRAGSAGRRRGARRGARSCSRTASRRCWSPPTTPARYADVDLPDGVEVWDRTRLVEAQERSPPIPGVTVLIHDQACAAEARRLRKRGEDRRRPTSASSINHRICEGCGDCGDVSNCLSVQPIDTPFGAKTDDRPDHLQPRLLVPRRRLPVVHDRRARRRRTTPGPYGGGARGMALAAGRRKGGRKGQGPVRGQAGPAHVLRRSPRARPASCRTSASPCAWPASAAPAWSPSPRSSAPRRMLDG